MRRLPALLSLMVSIGACAPAATSVPSTMNQIAERYVKLVLKVGQHDADYVDAYYGDPAWKPAGAPAALETLAAEAKQIAADLTQLKPQIFVTIPGQTG